MGSVNDYWDCDTDIEGFIEKLSELKRNTEVDMELVSKNFGFVLDDHVRNETGGIVYIETTIKEFNQRMKELRKNLTEMSKHVREIKRWI